MVMNVVGGARRTGAHAGTYRMQYVGEYAPGYGRDSGMGRAVEVYIWWWRIFYHKCTVFSGAMQHDRDMQHPHIPYISTSFHWNWVVGGAK